MNNRADEKTKLIDAPLDRVFDAIKNADKLALWWGPDGFTNTFHEFDFRKGGYWRFIMHGPDGKDYVNESCFKEIQENKKVVIEHISAPHFILTISLSSQGDKTIINWQQLFDTEEQYKPLAEFVSKANQENLDRLEHVIQSSI